MADYPISKEAVQKMLIDLRNSLGNERYISIGITMALHQLEGFPQMDAVPVVRCEYCKEAVECQLYGEHCGLPSEKGIFCEVWQTVVDKNGYCYHGTKMDGGAEG